MRDGLGILLVAAGLAWAVLTRDKLGLVIAFAGVTIVAAHGAVGPGPLANTCAGLDPALWFYGEWGCTFYERAKKRMPITELCKRCTYGSATP